jgi:HSP20 family protein
MSKKIPWWRKPNHENDQDDNKDNNDKSYKDDGDNREESNRSNPRDKEYGHQRRDWNNRPSELFGTSFDEDLDRFFSRSPFGHRDDLFMDFEREIGEMHERMDKIFKKAVDGNIEKPSKGGPFVYGFSMRTGPDGIPHVQEFGNMSPDMMRRFREANNLKLPGPGEVKSETAKSALPTREPLTDIIEHDDHFTITLELPGVDKKEIQLEIKDDILEVNVDTPLRQYFKKLPLPSEVDPGSIEASFNNGVLDVNVNRLKEKEKKGKRIKIK